MTAPILGSVVNDDGSVTVTYGRRDFSHGQVVLPASMRGDPAIQSIVDMLYDHESFTAQVVSRKQERARANG